MENSVLNQFNNFLNENRSVCKITHTGTGKNSGKYDFSDPKIAKQFYSLYKKVVFDYNTPIHLIEQHRGPCGFLVDIDLRYKEINSPRLYNKEFIKKIVKLYFDEIKKHFIIPDDEREEILQCFVFERKEPYTSKNVRKDGIHIQFPFIISDAPIQKYVREQVIKNKELDEMFKKMGITNSVYQAIDKLVIDQVGWYMFGSTKPGVERYNLTYLFNDDLEELDINTYDIKELPELMSIRNVENTEDKLELNDDSLELVLEYEDNSKKRNKKRESSQKVLTEDTLVTIYKLVDLLDIERANDFEKWIRLGWCLHNICPNSQELLLIWDEFSQKSKKYEVGACEKQWEMMKDNGLSIGSLYLWAKQDNPEGFNEFRKNEVKTIIENCLTPTHVDISRVLYHMYKSYYVCASIKNKIWYEFDNHKWQQIDEGIFLRNKISNELLIEYCNVSYYYHEQILKLSDLMDDKGDEMDEAEKKKIGNKITTYEKRKKLINDISMSLRTSGFIDSIMKEAKGLFYDKDFLENLDENRYLLGFKNGVLDLKNNIFRDGRPNDYISLSTNINYIPYSKDLEYIDDLMDFLETVQPVKNQREYMLTFISSLLEGHNADEYFHVWTGGGGNGKSKVNELILNSFGELCTKFPITLLTGKRAASNQASPEVIESKGKRYVFMEEPSENEKINIGIMKEYTGGDKIKGRGLYAPKFVEFKPQFKMVLYCNDLPKVPPVDDGTWRRLRVLEFMSRFVDNPKGEFEFKKDKYMSEKIPKWSEAFMSLLTHYYFNVYKVIGLKVPQEVLKATKEYQTSMDSYIDFFKPRLEFTGKKENKIELEIVYADFCAWYDVEAGVGIKIPSKKDIYKYLEKKMGKKFITMNFIYGVKYTSDIKKEEIDEKNSEEIIEDCY